MLYQKNFFSEFSKKLNMDLETKEVILKLLYTVMITKNEIRKITIAAVIFMGVFINF